MCACCRVSSFSRAADMKEDDCRGSARSEVPRIPVKDAGFTTKELSLCLFDLLWLCSLAPEIRHVYEKHATTCDYFLAHVSNLTWRG
jgi:hypothetical protein